MPACLAAAHLDAHRADAAVPARRRRHPRLGAAAAQRVRRRRSAGYLRENTDAGARGSTGSSFFDVYASPWFSAIYLLLFTSLVGCLVPRFRAHFTALLRKPPAAPAPVLPAAGCTLRILVGCAAVLRWCACCGAGGSAPSCAPTTATSPDQRREGVPEGDRQPASSTSRCCRCCSAWRPARGSAGTATGCSWRARTSRSATPCSSYDEHGLGARVGRATCRGSACGWTSSPPTYLDNGQPVTLQAPT